MGLIELLPCPKKKQSKHPENHVMKIYYAFHDQVYQVYCEACRIYEKRQAKKDMAAKAWNEKVKA